MLPDTLRRCLARDVKPALLCFYGPESYLLEQACEAALAALVAPADRDFNLDVFVGREVQAAQVLDILHTYPVMAPRRCVLIRQGQDLRAEQMERLQAYVEKPLAESCLILCCDKIDKRRKFFQCFKKNGQLFEFKQLSPARLPDFISRQVQAAGKVLTEPALQLLCQRVGEGLQEVLSEIDKLVLFNGAERLIDVEAVAAVVCDTRPEGIFELVEAVGERDLARALYLLERLLQDGEAPVKINFLIARHFRQLWKVQALLGQRVAPAELAQRAGVLPFLVPQLTRQARLFAPEFFPQLFDRLLQVDLALKSSRIDPAALLQHSLMELLPLAQQPAE